MVLGSVTGVATDAQNNVWVVHRGNDSLEANERGMVPVPAGRPPTVSSVCCMAAPFILQFDPAGQAVEQLGRSEQPRYRWPQATGGIVVDAKGNVWISAAGLEPRALKAAAAVAPPLPRGGGSPVPRVARRSWRPCASGSAAASRPTRTC